MTHKVVQIALLVAVASILFSVESLIQNPIPWMRLGLANIMTLLALRWWGMREAFTVVVMRILLGSFLTGKFLQPVFILSLAGGVTATVAMGEAMIYEKRLFSLIGISIIGALSKNLTQLLIAYFIYIRQVNIFNLVPLFLFSSLFTGLIIGFLAYILHEKFKSYVVIKPLF